MNTDALQSLAEEIDQCPLSLGDVDLFVNKSQGEGVRLPTTGPLHVRCLWGINAGNGLLGVHFQIVGSGTEAKDPASVYITGLSEATTPEVIRAGLAMATRRLAQFRQLSMVQLNVAKSPARPTSQS